MVVSDRPLGYHHPTRAARAGTPLPVQYSSTPQAKFVELMLVSFRCRGISVWIQTYAQASTAWNTGAQSRCSDMIYLKRLACAVGRRKVLSPRGTRLLVRLKPNRSE